ncbi:hypothetical protein C8R43DRAFT_525718 [Mycena crocata]|nr:hypothetical protein C8R43DRAFT_525718 [Mycena crocata]
MCPVRIPTERIRRFSTFAENGHSTTFACSSLVGIRSVRKTSFSLPTPPTDIPLKGVRTDVRYFTTRRLCFSLIFHRINCPDWRVRGSRAPPHVRKGNGSPCRSAQALRRLRCCGCSRVRGCIQDDSTTSCPARWRPRVQLLSNSIKIIASIHYSYRMNLRRASTSRMFFHSCTVLSAFIGCTHGRRTRLGGLTTLFLTHSPVSRFCVFVSCSMYSDPHSEEDPSRIRTRLRPDLGDSLFWRRVHVGPI